MLKEFGPAIWISDGPDVSVAGFTYPTRMAVIQFADGGLFLWSPIQPSKDLFAQVNALGPVHHIVAPNALHYLYLSDWQNAYPDARTHAPPGLRKKRSDITFDADLENGPHPDWAGQVDQVLVRGNLITTEVVFFHVASGTVLFTDLLQQLDAQRFSGWRAWIARLDLMVGPKPAVPRKFRTGFVNRSAARTAIRRILSWPCEKVLMAHGTPVTSDAPAYLAQAFRWLL